MIYWRLAAPAALCCWMAWRACLPSHSATFAAYQLLWQALHRWWANHAGRKGRTLETAVSITAALLLGGAACATLAGADDNFARLWGHLGSWLGQLFGQDALLANLLIFALSLPVGAWLFGLAGGSARRKAPPVAAEQFYGKLAACRACLS